MNQVLVLLAWIAEFEKPVPAEAADCPDIKGAGGCPQQVLGWHDLFTFSPAQQSSWLHDVPAAHDRLQFTIRECLKSIANCKRSGPPVE